jgi:hypothetical protein
MGGGGGDRTFSSLGVLLKRPLLLLIDMGFRDSFICKEVGLVLSSIEQGIHYLSKLLYWCWKSNLVKNVNLKITRICDYYIGSLPYIMT